jgi:hypothetical protein
LNENFISALCNGIGGEVNIGSLSGKEPHQKAVDLVGKDKDLNLITDWLNEQPFFRNETIKFATLSGIFPRCNSNGNILTTGKNICDCFKMIQQI